MAIVTISRITHRSGLSENLPTLAKAELGWALDSRKLYIGNGTVEEGAPQAGNTEILTEYSDVLALANTYTYKNTPAGYTPNTGSRLTRYNSIAYGTVNASNYWVAVGVNGAIVISLDGVNWTNVSSGTTKNLKSIAYKSGVFVAVGANGTIIRSTDAVTWTPSTNTVYTLLENVCASTSLFVAVGQNGTILTSSDGLTWTSRTNPVTVSMNSVSYGNSLYVAVGNGGVIITSSDAIAWTQQTSITSNYLLSVGYLNNQWVAVGQNNVVITSPDAVTWSYRFPDAFLSVTANTTFNSAITVAVGIAGAIYTTTSTVWTKQTSGVTTDLNSVYYANNMMVSVGAGGVILTSSDNGTTWVSRTSNISNNLNGVYYNSNDARWFAVGNGGVILTSDDNGSTWTSRTSGTINNLRAVSVFNLTYVAVGDNGTILTSSNGTTWTVLTTGIGVNLYSVDVANLGGGTYKAITVGANGYIYYSDDAATWTGVTRPQTQDLYGVKYFSGIGYTAVGNNGAYVTSVNGTVWADGTGTVLATSSHLKCIYKDTNYYWVLGGAGFFNAYSLSNNNWTLADILYTDLITPDLNDVAYGNGYSVVVGSTGEILVSSNGSSWHTTPSGITKALENVSFANSKFVAVGDAGIIANSTNATAWTSIALSFGATKTVRALQDKLDDFVSVKDFGAVGDGVTDDTEAINRALYELYCRVANSQARKTLYFPAGTYVVSDFIKVPSRARIKGDGPTNTLFQQIASPYVSPYVTAVFMTADSLQQVGAQLGLNGATMPSDIVISDIGVQSTGSGFYITSAKRVTLTSVYMFGPVLNPIVEVDPLSGTSWSGVNLFGANLTPSQDISLQDCYINSYHYGVSIEQSGTNQYAESLQINSTTFYNLFNGMHLNMNGGLINAATITNCTFDLIYQEAIRCGYAHHLVSAYNVYKNVGNWFAGGGSPQSPVLTFTSNSTGCTSTGDAFDRSDTDAIIYPRISGVATSNYWRTAAYLQQGFYSQTNGQTQALLVNQVSPVATNIVYSLTDGKYTGRIQYSIQRDTAIRVGILTITYNGTAVYLDDDYVTNNGDVGVTFSIIQDGTSAYIYYASTAGAATNFNLSYTTRATSFSF